MNKDILVVRDLYNKGYRKTGGEPLVIGYNGMCTCPSPEHTDKNPSAKINDKGVYCFVCAKQYSTKYIAGIVGLEVDKFDIKYINNRTDNFDSNPDPLFLLFWE